MGTSSARPGRLLAYPGVLREADDQLLRRAGDLQAKLEAFAARGGEFVSRGFDPAAEAQAVRDLAEESRRLSDWVARVGAAFRAADSGELPANGFDDRYWMALAGLGGGQAGDAVVVVPTADVIRAVGFPSLDVAVAQARQAARDLERLLTTPLDELDLADLQALFDTIARGRYDPAFAATFSNAIGVEGYVDATALIRYLYTAGEGETEVSAEGLEHVEALANTLTTALDTLPYIPEDEQRYRASADLPEGLRLSTNFLNDLISGYDPSAVAAAAQPQPEDVVDGDVSDTVWIRRMSQDVDLHRDLSVLLSFTEPPTAVAVDIANHRLTPWLDGPDAAIDIKAWVWGPALSGILTNYATMLGRNPNASARWLAADADRSGTNLERVLRRDSAADLNGGAAFATVVEQGLTHPSLRTPIPGAPTYVQGPLLREQLMDIAIDTIADQGEIRNDNLHMAFAAGVEANLDYIADRTNAPFDVGEDDVTNHMREQYLDTHDFLRETMGDVNAALAIRQAVFEYGFEQVTSPPEVRDQRLTQLGRLETVITEAQKNAEIGGAVEVALAASALGPTPGSLIDGGLSLAGNSPYPPLLAASAINDIGSTLGYSAGDVVDFLQQADATDDLIEQLDRANENASERRSLDARNEAIWLATGLYDPSTELGTRLQESAEAFHTENGMTGDEKFIDENGLLVSTITNGQAEGFVGWAMETRGHPDNDVAPLYDLASNFNNGFSHVMRDAAYDRDIAIEGRR